MSSSQYVRRREGPNSTGTSSDGFMAYKCESALSSRNLPSSFVNTAAVERGLALSRYKYLQQPESLASPRVTVAI
jgi:hypothetical protein